MTNRSPAASREQNSSGHQSIELVEPLISRIAGSPSSPNVSTHSCTSLACTSRSFIDVTLPVSAAQIGGGWYPPTTREQFGERDRRVVLVERTDDLRADWQAARRRPDRCGDGGQAGQRRVRDPE